MNIINYVSALVDVEMSLLVSKAKLRLCDCEDDLDDACYAENMANECGLRFETILFEIYDQYDEMPRSALLNEVITNIKSIYSNLPQFLKGGFDSGVGDVKIARAGLD